MAGAGRAASALMGSARGSGGSGDAGGEEGARPGLALRRICCCSCWILSASPRRKRTPSDVRQGRAREHAARVEPEGHGGHHDQRLTGLTPGASRAG